MHKKYNFFLFVFIVLLHNNNSIHGEYIASNMLYSGTFSFHAKWIMQNRNKSIPIGCWSILLFYLLKTLSLLVCKTAFLLKLGAGSGGFIPSCWVLCKLNPFWHHQKHFILYIFPVLLKNSRSWLEAKSKLFFTAGYPCD